MRTQLSFKRRLQLQVLNGKAIAYNPYNTTAAIVYKWAHVSKRG